MLIVDGKLVSDDILAEQFMCNLSACKGACCHEGDYGAPLEDNERAILEDLYPKIKPFLSEIGKQTIEEKGLYEWIEDGEEYATPCVGEADCAYMTRTPEGFSACGIELAFRAGATDFKKPISCELYPIRVVIDETAGFEALNYDRWDICSAACDKGKEHKMPVFLFVKDAIIRKWGADFYEQLEAAFEAGVYKKK